MPLEDAEGEADAEADGDAEADADGDGLDEPAGPVSDRLSA